MSPIRYHLCHVGCIFNIVEDIVATSHNAWLPRSVCKGVSCVYADRYALSDKRG